jgi:hypothetical protein
MAPLDCLIMKNWPEVGLEKGWSNYPPYSMAAPALAIGTGLGLIGRNDPLGTLGGGAIPKADQPVDLFEMLVPYLS